jgi:alpha-L-rhamnosidase
MLILPTAWQPALATDDIVLIHLENLKCEMLVNPKGIDVTRPRLSWQINSAIRGVKQKAYQIIVASTVDKLNKNEGDLWNSGIVNSDQSILVTYAGKTLVSRQECFWKVKVWTNQVDAEWSEPTSFTIGLLQPENWKANGSA